jgi:membrane dipeptidase
VLSRLGDNGGVCMVTFVPEFVNPVREQASIDDVVAHVEHVRDVAGVEHVGIGGDYDGVDVLPRGLEDVSSYPRLLQALADRGWSDTELAGLTCRNALRVMRDAGLTDEAARE